MCTLNGGMPFQDSVPFSSISQSDRVVSLPIVDVLSAKAEQLPLSFPKQFEDELLTHHSNPPVFFVSQVPLTFSFNCEE